MARPGRGGVSLLESVDIRFAEGGVTVVGVLVGAEEYFVDRVVGVMKDGGADFLVRHLPGMPDQQLAALIAIVSRGHEVTYLGFVLGTGLSLVQESRQRGTVGKPGTYEKIFEYRTQRRHSRFSRRSARMIG